MFIFFQIALLVLGVVLTVAVLMQHGKSYGLSGTIAGGAETFFGKEKGGRIDKMLSRATTVIGILFVVFALLTFMFQEGDYEYKTKLENMSFNQNSENYIQDEDQTIPTTDTTTQAES